MAIAFVGVTSGGAAGVSSLVITRTTAAGNSLFLSIDASVGVTNVVDSNGTPWTRVSNGSNSDLAYIINSPAITSVTITATATISAVLGEYSGVNSFVGATTPGGIVTSPWTVTRALTGTTDWLIAGGGVETTATPTITANTGNLRGTGTAEQDSGTTEWYRAILVDNTGTGSITCAANVTGGTLLALNPVGIEFSISGGPAVLGGASRMPPFFMGGRH